MYRFLLWSTFLQLVVTKIITLLTINKVIQLDISGYFISEILLVVALAIVLLKGTLVKSKLFLLSDVSQCSYLTVHTCFNGSLRVRCHTWELQA